MSTRCWVLLRGKRCSGKDTVAGILHRELGWKCTSFAEAVKRDCARNHGLDFERLMNDRDYKETHRQLIIDHAMKMRDIRDTWWAEAVVEMVGTDVAIVVVSDHRFLNEREVMKQNGAVVTVGVTASEETRRARGWFPRPEIDSHASECELDGVTDDVVIPNDGPGMPDVGQIFAKVSETCLARVGVQK